MTPIPLSPRPRIHTWSPSNEGKDPHYIFSLDTPTVRYQCVIDIFSRVNATEKKSINYLVVRPHESKRDSLSNRPELRY